MSATNAAQPRFKVGDRVRLGSEHYRFKSIGQREGTVIRVGGDFNVVVDFDGYNQGWSDDDGGTLSYWGFDDNIEDLIPVSSSPAAKFQVQYVEDFDCEFDTLEAAEEEAKELARCGGKVAVFKLVATAAPAAVSFERFA